MNFLHSSLLISNCQKTSRFFFSTISHNFQRQQLFNCIRIDTLPIVSKTNRFIHPSDSFHINRRTTFAKFNFNTNNASINSGSNVFKQRSKAQRTFQSNATNESTQAKEQPVATAEAISANSSSIFKKFKDAYKQHGKLLIVCHVLTSCVWINIFYFVSKSGFDLETLLRVLEWLPFFTTETSNSIMATIHNFSLEQFLRKLKFDYVLTESAMNYIGRTVTGETLKHMITAVMIYKIMAPLRYLATITVTKVTIDLFKKRGLIAQRPPPGHSIPELLREQRQNIKGRSAQRLNKFNLKKEDLKRRFKISILKKRLKKENGK